MNAGKRTKLSTNRFARVVEISYAIKRGEEVYPKLTECPG
jgi:hypothetical protein